MNKYRLRAYCGLLGEHVMIKKALISMSLLLAAALTFAGSQENLMDAAARGDEDTARKAVLAGADVNAADGAGETPLMRAAEMGRAGMVQFLLNHDAKVNAARRNGVTALMMASERGRTEAAKLLLKAEADVNARSKDGNTALIWASMRGHTEVVKMLLEKGADVKHANRQGITALKAAQLWRKDKAARVLLEAALSPAEKEARQAAQNDKKRKREAGGMISPAVTKKQITESRTPARTNPAPLPNDECGILQDIRGRGTDPRDSF